MFKNILVPTDGSEFADQSIAQAADFAKSLGAHVTLVMVSPSWAVIAPAEVAIAIPPEEYARNAAEHAKAVLEKSKAVVANAGVACSTVHVPERHPAEGILEAAEKNKCDLIAMASHGRRGLSKLLLGSTAQEVLTRSHIPVLVFRS